MLLRNSAGEAAGRVVPAEWNSHSHTIVSWPTRDVVWGTLLGQAYEEYVRVIEELLRYEQVVVVCRDEDRHTVERLVPHGVDVITHPIDDGWIRDNGPLAVASPDGLIAVDFSFNSWGGRFTPWSGDSSVGSTIAQHLAVFREEVPFVLEGGAITFDGNGTAVVVEECVLNPNRNGSVSRDTFERVVRRCLGVEKVIWLPYGLLEDLDNTDGHVDNVAVFVGEGRILAQVVDTENRNHERLARNIDVLRSSRDAAGVPLRVETISWLPYAKMPDGRMQPAPYLNFAITNRSVLIPSVGDAFDGDAARLIGGLFSRRDPTLVRSYALTYGGGGPHCITMQWPG
ncbi:agmatine deiminase family protein [Nocardia fluminea]|uniref:agmatine deiminase family protein n=1 Tax=Nocardia fluminea TaxID=134984 RepID=UPI0036631A1C